MGRLVLVVMGVAAAVAASIVVVLGVPGAGGAAGSMQARWVITDLGTLGGKESSAAAINERGQVVGKSDTRASPKGGKAIGHAVLWQNGKMRDLGSLAGSSWANDINDRGQVVGTSVSRTKNFDGLRRVEHAVLWQGGKMLDLTPTAKLAPLDCHGDGSGSCDASGDAINARGQVVVSMTSNLSGNLHIDRAFLWQNGRLINLRALGGDFLDETWVGRINDRDQWVGGINDRGQVVGRSDTRATDKNGDSLVHAFVWQNGKMTDLGTLPGKLESEASSINERGEITGRSENSYREGGIGAHCVVWQKGKVSDLGVAGGECFAGQINDPGQIVGWHETIPATASSPGDNHAFLWQDGNLTDLGGLDEGWGLMINARGTVVDSRGFVWQNGRWTNLPDLGGGGTYAAAINDRDQIVGYSTTKTGQDHAVLWTLKPGS